MSCGGCIGSVFEWGLLWWTGIPEIELATGMDITKGFFQTMFDPMAGMGQQSAADRTLTLNGADTARRIIYGRCQVGGQLAYAESYGSANENLMLVIILASHPCEDLTDLLLDDKPLWQMWENLFTFYSFHDGSNPSSVPADLLNNTSGKWTTAHTLTGCSYLFLRLVFSDKLFASGIPSIKVTAKGKKIYDPRTNTTVWSDNPALCIYDYMTLSETEGGMGCQPDEIDVDTIIAAANVCDELVVNTADGTGTEKRYTLNGTITLNSTPARILESMLITMAGSAVCQGGIWKIYAGQFGSYVPGVVIDETWLAGGFSFQIGSDKSARINTVTGNYIDPSDKWSSKGFDAVTDATLRDADGGEELAKNVDMPLTTSPTMARRLAKIFMRRSRAGATVNYSCNGKAFKLAPYDLVKVNNSILNWSEKPMRVTAWAFSPMGGVTLTLAEDSPWVYEWTAADMITATDYIPPTLGPLTMQHQSILDNVPTVGSIYQGNQLWLTWRPIYPMDPVRYEIRRGDTYATAMIVGITTDNSYPTSGDGTYYVTGVTDYGRSAAPASTIISGSMLIGNVVATWDESATGWTGTKTGGAEVDGAGRLWLGNAAGVVSASGAYEQTGEHIVNLGSVQTCQCSVKLNAASDNVANLFDDITDFDNLPDVDGDYAGHSTVTCQIDTSQNNTTWDGYRDFVPGYYAARRFRFRLLLTSSNTAITAVVSEFVTTVDMADRIATWTGHSLAAGGETFTYDKPFQVTPNVQVTVANSQSGDYVLVTSSTASGFTAQIKNGSSGVARTVNILAKGY